MAWFPNGRYIKEFREKVVKLATEEGTFRTSGLSSQNQDIQQDQVCLSMKVWRDRQVAAAVE